MKKLILVIVLTSLMQASARDEEIPGQPVTGAELKALAVKLTEDRFQLWNHCFPVRVRFSITPLIGAYVSGLEKEEVEAIIRSRLQNVQLFTPEHPMSSILKLVLEVESETFTIRIAHIKVVKDPASGVSASVETWVQTFLPEEVYRSGDDFSTVRTKRHNKDKEYVLYWVSKYVDKFIEEYLRVNADACAHR